MYIDSYATVSLSRGSSFGTKSMPPSVTLCKSVGKDVSMFSLHKSDVLSCVAAYKIYSIQSLSFAT
jgi:hypothetical protein